MPLQALGVDIGEPAPLHDAGVVDQDVEPPEPVEGRGDQRLRALGRGDVVLVGQRRRRPRPRSPAATADATPPSAPTPLYGAAEVVDDDAGTAAGQEQRVGAADAAARARDDRDASLETVHVHVDPALRCRAGCASGLVRRRHARQAAPWNPRRSPRVPPTMAARSSSGTPANSWLMSCLLPRNVPSACG